jgi:CheY-like chemotaxis protein
VALVVEDDPLLRLDAAALLEDAGFETVDFASADRALSYLQGHAERVTLIFTDIALPGQLDGVGLARTACLAWPWLTVIVTSGEIAPATLPEWAIFLPKPWRPAELLSAAASAAGSPLPRA